MSKDRFWVHNRILKRKYRKFALSKEQQKKRFPKDKKIDFSTIVKRDFSSKSCFYQKSQKNQKIDNIFHNKASKRISHYKKRRNEFLNNKRLKRCNSQILKPYQVKCESNSFLNSKVKSNPDCPKFSNPPKIQLRRVSFTKGTNEPYIFNNWLDNEGKLFKINFFFYLWNKLRIWEISVRMNSRKYIVKRNKFQYQTMEFTEVIFLEKTVFKLKIKIQFHISKSYDHSRWNYELCLIGRIKRSKIQYWLNHSSLPTSLKGPKQI